MKIMRTIMPACLLIALIAVYSPVVGEETMPEAAAEKKSALKTTAELIAEVESPPEPTIKDPVPGEEEPKTAAEIMAEIESLSKPAETVDVDESTEEPREETATADADETEELPLESEPLPDEVIGEYAVDDFATDVASDTDFTLDSAAPVDQVASESLFEKADALEPSLMIAGTPEDDDIDAMVSEKISGRIIAEKKPLDRRRHLYRWVLKSEDGLRIPLKSNIKLLQEVRRENILDSQVSLTGRYVQSGYSDQLRYFIVESVVVIDDEVADSKTPGKAAGKKK